MEIERKFLLKSGMNYRTIILNRYDEGLLEIQQAYLVTDDDMEIRIRKIEEPMRYILDAHECHCFMAIKSSGDMIREEIEFEIPRKKYLELIHSKMIKGKIIEKTRYKIREEDDSIVEIDVFEKELHGLILIEVEFDSEEEANKFEKPYWFGTEVTNDKKYKNKNLALN